MIRERETERERDRERERQREGRERGERRERREEQRRERERETPEGPRWAFMKLTKLTLNLSLGVSICLERVSIETLDRDKIKS